MANGRGRATGQVLDLRGAGQELGMSLAGIGAGLGEVFKGIRSDEDRMKMALRDHMMENPEQLAIAQRAHELSGAEGPGPAAEFGMEGIVDMFPPGMSELVDRFMQNMPDAVETFAESQVEGARAAGETARLEGERAGALRDVDEPELAAETRAESLEAERATAEFERRKIQTLLDLDFPEQSAQSMILQSAVQDAQNQQQLDALNGYAEWVQTLPEEEQGHMLAAIANPRGLQHLEFLDNLDLQTTLGRWRFLSSQRAAQMSPVDVWDFKEKINTHINELVEQFREAKDAGDDDLIASLRGRIADAAYQQAMNFPNDIVTTAEGIEEWFGEDFKDINFGALTGRAYIGLARLASGEVTIEEIQNDPEIDPQLKEEIATAWEAQGGTIPPPSVPDSAERIQQSNPGSMTREEIQTQIEQIERTLQEVRGSGEPDEVEITRGLARQRQRLYSKLSWLNLQEDFAEFFHVGAPAIESPTGGTR